MTMPIIVVHAGVNARNEKVAFLACARHSAVFAYQQRHVVVMPTVSTLTMIPTIVVRVGINVRNEKVVGMEYARD